MRESGPGVEGSESSSTTVEATFGVDRTPLKKAAADIFILKKHARTNEIGNLLPILND